jgi:hypothetical protein
MTWPNGTRYKDAAPGGSWTPADMNAVQDQVLQVAGHRGKSIITTEETRTNTAYGLLTTPDRVSGIVLPEDGLIAVGYKAQWKSSVQGAGAAAIFVGSTQLGVPGNAPGVSTEITTQHSFADLYGHLFSTAGWGLEAFPATADDPTTPTLLGGRTEQGLDNSFKAGGVAYIFAAAGTYDVSVQFKASSGSVTAKNRKLWVWTEAFA